MKSIGIVFGCFIPLHLGHIKLIDKAFEENDEVLICTCGYPGDRGENFIPFDDRIKLIKDIYGDVNNVILSNVNDHEYGLSGLFDIPSWKIWCKALFENAQNKSDKTDEPLSPYGIYTWYSGESNYLSAIKSIYPYHKFRKLERMDLPVSGTMIREEPEKNKDFIHPVFRKYLSEKGIIKD